MRLSSLVASLVLAAACHGQSCLPNWSAVGENITGGEVHALAMHNDGKGAALYAGGDLTLDGSTLCSVARWDGQSWTAVGDRFGFPTSPQFGVMVNALASFDDGTGSALYAAGAFKTDGTYCAARWDGQRWTGIGQGLTVSAFWPTASSLHVHQGGLYIGGPFSVLGITAGGIARWTSAGWTSVGGGLEGVGELRHVDVWSMVTFQDRLYVSGTFRGVFAPPVNTPGVAWFDGTAWHSAGWDGQGASTFNGPRGLTVHPNGSVPTLWGGGFNSRLVFHQQPAAWGSIQCSGFASTNEPAVNVCASFNDGTGPALYFGGAFTSMSVPAGGYANTRNLGRRSGACTPFPDGPNAPVYAALVVSDKGQDALLVGGAFTEVGGKTVSRVARLGQCATCYPDCNGDGGLTLADFGCFTTKFALGDLYADCNGDGLLQLSDFGCFQTKFLLGCR